MKLQLDLVGQMFTTHLVPSDIIGGTHLSLAVVIIRYHYKELVYKEHTYKEGDPTR